MDNTEEVKVLGATQTHDVGGSSHVYEHVQAYMDGGLDIDANQDVYEEFIDNDGLVDNLEFLDELQVEQNEEACPNAIPIP